jgi:hypothetical protein
VSESGSEYETYGQVAPLRAELEDPETPVLIKACDLIPRVVVRPEAVFDGQTRVLRTEVDDVLRIGFNDLDPEHSTGTEVKGAHTSRIHLA